MFRKCANKGLRILIFICVLMFFCITLEQDIQKSEAEEIELSSEYSEENAILDLGSIFSDILNKSPRSFFAGYAINESFLLWLDAQYGDETIINIASCIQRGENDVEIWYRETGSSIHVLWLEYCRSLNYSSYQFSNVTWQECSRSSAVVLDFVGDINFDEDWYTTVAMEQREGGIDDCITAEIQKELQSADITLVNNEFTYSSRGEPLAGKSYTFRADPKRVEQLAVFGADIVSLGNNHVCDYGDVALIDTLDTLDEAGIPYVGAGRNITEAEGIRYFVANGRKIAIVSATQIEKYYNYTKEAGVDSPGVLKTLDPERFLSVIEKARQSSDYVIAYVHWGVEGVLYPGEDQRSLAKSYAAAGADVIIGNHSHRLQGVEYIDGVPVFYGLGNFWFSTGSLYTTILQLRIDASGSMSVSMLPCVQRDLTTSLLTQQQEKAEFYQYIADLSVNVGINVDGTLQDLSGTQYTEEELERFSYRTGQHYAKRTGSYDLDGVHIDIVGNR